MPASTQSAGTCPKCAAGAVLCRFNFFDRGDLVVHSWEHKCGNCGWRETQAYRSDTPPPAADIDPAICPWCGRRGATA
jgi:ssDNA-binding Zn-finger/Zn-ribbon topoisomerase 1